MDAFIFDMDGVIIDSEPIHFKVDIETMNNLGLEGSREEVEKYTGMIVMEMWKLIVAKYKIKEPVGKIVERGWQRRIEILRESNMEPIDGVVKLLKELKKRQVPTAIASSSTREFIGEVLKKFSLSNYFRLIVSGDEVSRGKPQPDIYLKTARQLGVDPRKCVVMEDSGNGILAAKRAGMKCIGYKNENSGKQDLSKADILVNSIEDVNLGGI